MRNFSVVALLFALCFNFNVNAQRRKKKSNKDTKEWRYDIECEGIAKRGSKLVKIWSYSKKPKFAIAQAMKNAVHGIVFKGYAGGGNGCTSFKPLVSSANENKDQEAFFKTFFSDQGDFRKYVTAAADGNIAPGDRLKISRKSYKIGVVVNVATDELRKKLEAAGIIRGLNSGF
ncbi:hypothetical protein [Tenacibaculum finnmarkense]|uniref:hypothetical protein n=1 Tax=Tenacibaculum finnmarkense TaxID=2781243 RepID=UPI001E46F1B2|nr:hypothetical protein [Tenacibaculum finnmarkense]MCD8447525.1 hypothetical protein [Tenacibaculum finnmarkense genomovar finnmarkense]